MRWLGAITRDSSGRSGVSCRALSGSRASVRLMRCMRSMSTASASRKMLAIAWPATWASVGGASSGGGCTGGPCMRPAPMISSRSAPRWMAGDSGAVCRIEPSPYQPACPSPSTRVGGKMNGMADEASRCCCVMAVGTAMRCWRSHGATGRAML